MSPKEEKDLIMHALTFTEKYMQEEIANIAGLRTRLSAIPVISPDTLSDDDRYLLNAAITATAHTLVTNKIKDAQQTPATAEHPIDTLTDILETHSRYAIILDRYNVDGSK